MGKIENLLVNQPAFASDKSFSIMVRPCIDLVFPYHMHPDYQLNLVVEGKGTRVVGDHSEEYSKGDLVLIGPNLPHHWSYDECFLKEKGKGKTIIIHFKMNFAGDGFLSKPETKPISELLERSYRGIKFHGNIRDETSKQLCSINEEQPLSQLVRLITILSGLALTSDFSLLAGPAYENHQIPEQEFKIKRIIHFMNQNFSDIGLSLEKLAGMASMSTTSFSKYFKKNTGQNYIEVMTNIKLSQACKKLADTDASIAQIAHNCGYNNISNFNKLFRQRYKCTPKEFKDRIT